MKRICVSTGNRAEEGLLKPVMDRIEKHPDMELLVWRISDSDPIDEILRASEYYFENVKPDVALLPTDRKEMLMVAIAAFFTGIPIIHFHAGDMNPTGSSYDETIRPMISLMSKCWLCNGKESAENVKNLLKSVSRPTTNVHNVGSTAFDAIEIDNSLVPLSPYDLVLYHPPTLTPEVIPSELDEIEHLIRDNPARLIFWGYPNGDEPGSNIIIERIKEVKRKYGDIIYVFKNIPRPQFLGFMRSCSRFIGNSSSMVYEAPEFLSNNQIIQIGNRNAGRVFDSGNIERGASEKIIKILEGINFDKI